MGDTVIKTAIEAGLLQSEGKRRHQRQQGDVAPTQYGRQHDGRFRRHGHHEVAGGQRGALPTLQACRWPKAVYIMAC